MVRTTIAKEYPDALHPVNLAVTPWTPAYLSSDPPYLMLRHGSIVSPKKQSELLAAWDRVKATSPRHYKTREEARSATFAYHWVFWEVTTLGPYISRESRQQTEEAILASDRLPGMVKEANVHQAARRFSTTLPTVM